MSIFEFDTAEGADDMFGADSFGGLPSAASDIPDMPLGMTQPQKRLWLARYYRQIMSGQRPAPPPPSGTSVASVRRTTGSTRPSGPSGPSAPAGPSAPSRSGGGSPDIAQVVNTARQVPGMVNAVSSVLSTLNSGLSTGDADPNASASVSMNGEFFDDELSWPEHRHYTYMWPYRTSPLGAQDPFTNADFGVEDEMGADEQFWCASNQLPSMIYG